MHTRWLKIGVSQLIKFLTVNFIEMAKISIKQTKSKIGSTQRQKNTLQALGLRKMNSVVVHEENNQIKGMIDKVAHLVTVERVK